MFPGTPGNLVKRFKSFKSFFLEFSFFFSGRCLKAWCNVCLTLDAIRLVAGSVSVAFILTMICYWSYTWGINADFTDRTSDQFVPLFRTSFPSLSGMLALGLFIHNAIITLCKNNKHPEHNVSPSLIV